MEKNKISKEEKSVEKELDKTERLIKKELLKKEKINKEFSNLQKLKEARKQSEAELEALRQDNHKTYDAIKKSGIFDLKGIWREFRNKHFPEQVYLINMELRNGFFAQFMITTKTETFRYMGGEYLIDDDLKYYNVSARMWSLDYHQDLVMAIRRKVDVNTLKKAIQHKGITDIDTATNPFSLREFIKSEVIQKVLKGADLDAVFRFMKNMLILNVAGTAVLIILILRSMGIIG